MSVLVSKRNESKIEAVTYAIELHQILTDLMRRNFGIRDLEHHVQMMYAREKIQNEDFDWYFHLLTEEKKRLDHVATLLTNNVQSAYDRYPTNLEEYQIRRNAQNDAIVYCKQLLKELQRVVCNFDLDLNTFGPCVRAIDREINLIKRWRQRDNKIKSSLKG